MILPSVAEAEGAAKRRRQLIIAGATILGAGYATSANIAIGEDVTSGLCIACEGTPPKHDDTPLWGLLPIAGPLVLAGKTPVATLKHEGYSDAAVMANLAPYLTPALVQVGGLAVLIVGLATHAAPTKVPAVGAWALPGGGGASLALRF